MLHEQLEGCDDRIVPSGFMPDIAGVDRLAEAEARLRAILAVDGPLVRDLAALDHGFAYPRLREIKGQCGDGSRAREERPPKFPSLRFL